MYNTMASIYLPSLLPCKIALQITPTIAYIYTLDLQYCSNF